MTNSDFGAKPEDPSQMPSSTSVPRWLLSEPQTLASGGTWKPLLEPKTRFRLLLLLPGGKHDPITAELYTFDRVDAPGYIAMSYRCGDNNDNELLHVNGRDLLLRETVTMLFGKPEPITAAR